MIKILQNKWVLFTMLCLIWGSSFLLMKIGMFSGDGSHLLSAYQVASLRMLSAGLVMTPLFPKAWKAIPNQKKGLVCVAGLLGSFLPAYFFCIAESTIDSFLAGMLNALTPLFTIAVAGIIYKSKVERIKWLGVLVGFSGCILLFLPNYTLSFGKMQNAFWVIAATVMYGFNVNMVKQHLVGVTSLQLTTFAFVSMLPIALLILVLTGYFNLPLITLPFVQSNVASILLGIIGSALATILFYRLALQAGILFASLVTYGIPFVAIGWGWFLGEKISLMQTIGLLIILGGVFIANFNPVNRSKTVEQ